jgi:hypothetical protein
MTTQNQIQPPPCTFVVGTANGTYYGPWQTGAVVSLAAGGLAWSATTANAFVDMNGYDHLSIQGYVTAVGAATATLTVESDDGVTNTYAWPETLGAYDSITNGFAASYIGTGGVNTYFHLHLDDCNGRRFHVKLVTTDNTAGAVLTVRQTKV